MRVTKVIREYVEREIKIKFNEKIAEVRREYDEKIKEFERRLNELCDETEIKAYEIARSMGLDYRPTARHSSVSISSSYFENTEQRNAVYEKVNTLRDRERKAVEDILLNLELGETTKSELKGAIDAVEV